MSNYIKMKNKGIVIFLIILALIIVAVMVGEFVSQRPNKSGGNPYEYNIDEFKNVDPELVKYKETKQFKIGFEQPTAIDIANGKIYITGDKSVKIIDFSGKLLNEIQIQDDPKTIDVDSTKIYVGLEKQILVFAANGDKIDEWTLTEENSFITSIATFEENIFVADAGMRKVIRFSPDGTIQNEFEGKNGGDVLHGFIIPSPYFDLDINQYGDLWVVNPGMHAFENYTYDGNLREYWENTSMMIDGFSGCCNPAHFAFLEDGSFVTSEKGLVRIKVHKPSGEFASVVAAPTRFKAEGEAPDIAIDDLGNIYALDFDKKIVRVFELK